MRSSPLLPRRARTAPLLAILATVILAAACNADASRGTADAPAGGVVDSALPIPELLARFRAATADTPTTLSGGAKSPERLARALLAALGARDTAGVRALVMSRGEFAWLYYPHTKFTAPPYELGPDLVWIPLVAASDKGAGRLLSRFGGQALRIEALTCPDTVTTEGPNTIVSGCSVRFAGGDSAARDLRIFSSLLSRDGRYKFLSYANDL